jgi:hypothetical protein
MQDNGFAKLRRINDDELVGSIKRSGLLEKYCFLLSEKEFPIIKDIHFKDG